MALRWLRATRWQPHLNETPTKSTSHHATRKSDIDEIPEARRKAIAVESRRESNVIVLMVYLIFALMLYLLPPGVR